jgi:NADH:ubiquinone oxidoreductase subunit F (NADH-binding)
MAQACLVRFSAYIYIRGEFYHEASNLIQAVQEAYKGNVGRAMAFCAAMCLTLLRGMHGPMGCSGLYWQERVRDWLHL